MTDIEVDPGRERLRAAWRALGRDGFYQDPEYGDLYEAKLKYLTTRPYWDQRAPREPVGKAWAY